MGEKKKKKNKNELKIGSRISLVKETPRIIFKNRTHLKITLKRALEHLRHKQKYPIEASRESCNMYTSTKARIDDQVKLRCRQLPNVVQELRKSVMRQNWSETATLLMILCHPGLKLYSSLIIKTCFVLLFNHPKSNLELLQNFIRNTTGYILNEDINKFIRILFALRKSALTPLESGKYIRNTSDYKVTRDPEFEKL